MIGSQSASAALLARRRPVIVDKTDWYRHVNFGTLQQMSSNRFITDQKLGIYAQPSGTALETFCEQGVFLGRQTLHLDAGGKLEMTMNENEKNPVSMCLWACLPALPREDELYYTLMSMANYTYMRQRGCQMYVYHDGSIRLLSRNSYKNPTWSYQFQSDSALIAANKWFHACATFDGAIWTLYLNGVRVAGGAGEIFNSLNRIQFNSSKFGEEWQYSGETYLADARVYLECLSADDVYKIYRITK